LGAPLPGLHHGLDKVNFLILTIDPQHGCLFWYLATVQHLYDLHRKLKQPFFKIIPLLRHLFLQSPFIVQYWFFYSSFDVGRSMFDVHLFQSVLGKNNLALYEVSEI
jgi:hypothetical protein